MLFFTFVYLLNRFFSINFLLNSESRHNSLLIDDANNIISLVTLNNSPAMHSVQCNMLTDGEQYCDGPTDSMMVSCN